MSSIKQPLKQRNIYENLWYIWEQQVRKVLRTRKVAPSGKNLRR